MRHIMYRVLLVLFSLLFSPVWGVAQNEVITFTRSSDGGTSVVTPAESCLVELQRPVGSPRGVGECPPEGYTRAQALQWVLRKNVPPTALDVHIRFRTELPPTRRFRNAWRINALRMIEENLIEVRKIRRAELMREITVRLRASTDAEILAADTGNISNQAAHRQYRNALRALGERLQGDLDMIDTIAALTVWFPSYPIQPP